ncbi:MAG: GtrA family protein [Acutalibacteraceae bacterium]|nr:GtrA family protein [Acutalibacteraceae bacterium]
MKNIFLKHKEIILYVIFGVLTTLVGWGSYVLSVDFIGLSVFVSSIVSWVCGVVFAFVTNKIWVFESRSWKPAVMGKELVTFVSSRAITGVIEVFGVPLLESTGFDNIFYNIARNLNLSLGVCYTKGIYSKLSLSVIVVILNYIFSKLFVFKDTKDK